MSHAIPTRMQAFVLEGHGGLDRLVLHENWPVPTPGDQQVLVRVLACGLNNTDINTRTGWYSSAVTGATNDSGPVTINEQDPSWGGAPLQFPRIQGADAVGVVVASGASVDASVMGKRVMIDCWLRDWQDPMNRNKTGYFGSECDGGFAEYTVVDHRNVGVVTDDLSAAELATFSCSYTTAEGMLERAQVTDKDTVLITGASGGVGSALVQLAKRRGAKTVALASPAKHAALEALGADVLLPRNPENLKASLADAIDMPSVSVVADIVGGDYFATLIDVLERGGRYTCSGAIAGPIVSLDLRTLYLRDLTFTGSTVVPPQIFKDVVSYINNGEIKPLLAASYSLEQLHAAQQAFVDKQHVGNIVVTME